MSDQWDKAQEAAEYGWSLIPVHTGKDGKKQKTPLIKWRYYQDERASSEQLEYWAKEFPDALVGVVTGAISGFVVVDCDNDDALAYCKESGVWSPVRVKTRRGTHLIFRHPCDGRRFGPKQGGNSTGYDWPQFPGLDFRGDGSYAVSFMSPDYSLDCDPGFDIFDLEGVPVWEGWPMDAPEKDVEDLDLSTHKVLDGMTEWDRTGMYVGEHYPGAKIPTGAGNGRNDRVTKWAGECVASGIYGADLEARVLAFMNAFYMDPLDEEEWKATCKSVEAAERRNHPERVAMHEAKAKVVELEIEDDAEATVTSTSTASPLLYLADAAKIEAEAKAIPFIVAPFLPAASIVHVSGYTGHGKSMVVSHIMANAAVGRPSIGPFEIVKPSRILYLDYENGRLTLSRRLASMFKAYGDPGDRLGVWTPWLNKDDMPLFDNAALSTLSAMIRSHRPDVVVIDTARSAFPGLSENDAEAWAPINRLMKRLQIYGVATILIHHKNKPQQGGFSREAGSTAQLNIVEAQLYVTQVYKDKDSADAVAGIHDESFYAEPIWPKMEEKARTQLGLDYAVVAIYEVRYGKVRDWSDLHQRVQWMALCSNIMTGEEIMIGSASIKQKAIRMYAAGTRTDFEIARTLGISLKSIREWLGLTST